MNPDAMTVPAARTVHLDRLGTLLSVVGVAALWLLPFVVFKINRIVSGHPRVLFDVLPLWSTLTFYLTLTLVAVIAVAVGNARIRLIAALLGIVAVALVIGGAADALTPPGNRWVRISPGAGFWVLLIALGLVATDAIARLQPRPAIRVLALLVTAAVVAAALASGYFDHLSIMREYAVNASRFAREARQHVLLAVGSLVAAVLFGLPLGVLCHRLPRIRAAILEVLSLIQTIPSIALFGILMVPLGALAAREPWAGQLGISGIGAAPAVIALFLYSLLPVVVNTVAGLARVSPATVDAARGMGLTNWQILIDIEFILALPVILTGIRIVLVQNIGLVTIAALIGGGGFGTFVFQGLGQTAIDLVLLGAIPTVALAFSSAVLLDAVVDVMNKTLR
jgi:osmoprotectant transport system permease protein